MAMLAGGEDNTAVLVGGDGDKAVLLERGGRSVVTRDGERAAAAGGRSREGATHPWIPRPRPATTSRHPLATPRRP
jgi:hypothetical protein